MPCLTHFDPIQLRLTPLFGPVWPVLTPFWPCFAQKNDDEPIIKDNLKKEDNPKKEENQKNGDNIKNNYAPKN